MLSVSILLPTYEPDPAHLREAVECVLRQTEKEWTLLIHDDASVADVRSMIESFLSDPRITFIRSEKRLGIGGNWNACLKSASAPFLQFLFQDDAWQPEFLAAGLSVLRDHPRVGMVSLGYHYQVEADVDVQEFYADVFRRKTPFLIPGKHDGPEILSQWVREGLSPCVPGEPSFVMLRTATARAAGAFLEDMPQLLDCEYWSRMLLHGDWYVQPGDLGFFRVHEASASMRNQRDGVGLYDRVRCLERVRASLPVESRKNIDDFFVKHLAAMIRKFFHRTGTGRNVSGGGSSAIVGFALRHPLLVLRALATALASREGH